MDVKEWSKLNNKDTERGHKLIVRTPFTSSQSLFIFPRSASGGGWGHAFFPFKIGGICWG